MRKQIIEMCRSVEAEHDVTVLFAIENGSRAWRMESADSDYDVRFVFVRKLDAYVSFVRKKDVIERMDGDIDLVGFDIYKFLGLLAKSNPTMMEWLFSDILYIGEQPAVLQKWAQSQSNWFALYHHYRSLCRNNYAKYIQSGNKVTGKKYLYVFRGLINAKYVERFKKVPPIHFEDAMRAVDLSDAVSEKLGELLVVKREGREADIVERIDVFDQVVDEFLNSDVSLTANRSDISKLDMYIRELLL